MDFLTTSWVVRLAGPDYRVSVRSVRALHSSSSDSTSRWTPWIRLDGPSHFSPFGTFTLWNCALPGALYPPHECWGFTLKWIIKEDRLGLDAIYVQAKRWEGCVGRPEIQKFAGALSEQRARKGVFLTTGYFSEEAKTSVTKIDAKLVLIDGELLAQYMMG
jgi:hypothetical protein